MHEMALCLSLLRILEEEAERQSFSRVSRVWVAVGALSHVAPEALAFCFEVASRDTLAAGATLEIEITPGEARCLTCDCTVTLAARHEPCPHCQGHRLQVVGGEELRIRNLEVR